jgi:hypothetical protein
MYGAADAVQSLQPVLQPLIIAIALGCRYGGCFAGEGCRAAASAPRDAEKLVACGRTMVFTMVRSEKEHRS